MADVTPVTADLLRTARQVHRNFDRENLLAEAADARDRVAGVDSDIVLAALLIVNANLLPLSTTIGCHSLAHTSAVLHLLARAMELDCLEPVQ